MSYLSKVISTPSVSAIGCCAIKEFIVYNEAINKVRRDIDFFHFCDFVFIISNI